MAAAREDPLVKLPDELIMVGRVLIVQTGLLAASSRRGRWRTWSRRLARVGSPPMRKLLAGILVTIVAVVLMPGTAWAVPFNISPTSGPPGQAISAIGGEIDANKCNGTAVNLELIPPGGGAAVDTSSATPSSGTWNTGADPLIVPNTAEPGQVFTVTADCVGEPDPQVTYDDADFTVTEPPPCPLRPAGGRARHHLVPADDAHQWAQQRAHLHLRRRRRPADHVRLGRRWEVDTPAFVQKGTSGASTKTPTRPT